MSAARLRRLSEVDLHPLSASLEAGRGCTDRSNLSALRRSVSPSVKSLPRSPLSPAGEATVPLLIMWWTVGQRTRAFARARGVAAAAIGSREVVGDLCSTGSSEGQAAAAHWHRWHMPHGRVGVSMQARQHDAVLHLLHPVHNAYRPRRHKPRLRRRCLPTASLSVCQAVCVWMGV
jgi:hypothetical protein